MQVYLQVVGFRSWLAPAAAAVPLEGRRGRPLVGLGCPSAVPPHPMSHTHIHGDNEKTVQHPSISDRMTALRIA